MRKFRGPYLTLLAGAILAAVLLGLDIRATPSQNVAQQLGTAAASAAPTTSPAATPSAPASTGTATSSAGAVAPPTAATTTTAPNPAVHDYTGRVDGGGASVAISIYNGKAIAYVCGGTFEVWFTGTAQNGKLALTGRYGATLTARYDATHVYYGRVVGSGRHWTFTTPAVKAPSGLYRSYTKKKGLTVQATWIVLPDGGQTGAEDAGGDTATAAPVGPIDFATGTAVLPDGQTVQPTRLDGSMEGS